MNFLYLTVLKCFRLKTLQVYLFLAIFCSVSWAAPTEPDILVSLVKNGVYPSLSISDETAGKLAKAARNLCEHPKGKNLQRAKEAWRSAFLAWHRATPFMFGPAGKLDRRIGRWPVNRVVLDAIAASADYRHMADDTDVRGFSAAEYLLFTPDNAKDATSGERCTQLMDVTEEIAERISMARLEWEQKFGDEFMSAGNGKPFLVPGDALSLALAEILNVTEQMLWDRIGTPGGFFEGDTKPESLEAWRSKNVTAGFRATLEGISLAVNGDKETSITGLVATKDGLVESKDPALADAIVKQIGRIVKAIDALGDSDNVFKDTLKLKGLYKQIQKLQDQFIEAALVLELDVRSSEEKAN